MINPNRPYYISVVISRLMEELYFVHLFQDGRIWTSFCPMVESEADKFLNKTEDRLIAGDELDESKWVRMN